MTGWCGGFRVVGWRCRHFHVECAVPVIEVAEGNPSATTVTARLAPSTMTVWIPALNDTSGPSYWPAPRKSKCHSSTADAVGTLPGSMVAVTVGRDVAVLVAVGSSPSVLHPARPTPPTPSPNTCSTCRRSMRGHDMEIVKHCWNVKICLYIHRTIRQRTHKREQFDQ